MSITIKDIALRANVSAATVSRVLNKSGYVKKETKDRIMAVIKEVNYIPSGVARSLSKNQTNTIGVMLPDLSNPICIEVVKGVSSMADKNGFNIIVCSSEESRVDTEMKYLKMLKEQRIRGLILTPIQDDGRYDSEYLTALEDLNIPVVLVARDINYSSFDAVFIDNIKGAYDGTEALIKEGHKDIAIISGPITSKPGRDRLRGYKKALRYHNIPVNEDYILMGDFEQDSGYQATKKILAMNPRPTAIFVTNNLMNLGCQKALIEAQCKVPDDMAIVGFDQVAMFDILGLNISVVERETYKMGELAMEILLDKFKGEDSNENTASKRLILAPKLVLKGSEKKIN